MFTVKGTGVSSGTAVGRILLKKVRVSAESPASAPALAGDERARAEIGIEKAKKKLSAMYGEAFAREGEEAAEIFEIHRMMLEDEDFLDAIFDRIENGNASAEAAVRETEKQFSELLCGSGNEYTSERDADIRDVAGLLLRCIAGEDGETVSDSPVILVADELLPSDIVSLGKEKLLGAVMTGGSPNSHASILARSLGVPAVIRAELDPGTLCGGMTVIVDGDTGKVIFEPDEDAAAAALAAERERKTAEDPENKKKRAAAGSRSRSGLALYLNISSPEEAESGVLEEADGIGLFRTEFLYLGRSDLPGEEEQLESYTRVLRAAKGKKVVIRTFDLGADKQTPALPLAREENPALGRRGLRVYFSHQEVFRTHLRALLRSAVSGDLRLMVPMVTSSSELERIREIAASVAAELEGEGLSFRIPPLGAMIETPAAAVTADRIAEKADFLSVGTNDLTQYSLAIDRENGSLGDFYDPYHEAILRQIRFSAEGAHKAGKKVSICGELAADPSLTGTFAEIGVDALSVSPALFPALAEKVRY